MSKTILDANNIKIYPVLSDFAKCHDSSIKSAPRVPKIEGGRFSPYAHIKTVFLNGFPEPDSVN